MNIINELLLSFMDIAVVSIDLFDPYKIYGKSTKDYLRWRESHHMAKKETGRLAQEGYIEKQNNRYVITNKAKDNVSKLIAERVRLAKVEKWDGLFRVVVFDIPEKQKTSRDCFRRKLKAMGFEMIQKSVFCHPHDCTQEVIFFSKLYGIERYISMLEVVSVVTDRDIFKSFRQKGFI